MERGPQLRFLPPGSELPAIKLYVRHIHYIYTLYLQHIFLKESNIGMQSVYTDIRAYERKARILKAENSL